VRRARAKAGAVIAAPARRSRRAELDRAERQLDVLRRRLETLFACSRALFEARTQPELLRSVCQRLIGGGDIVLAFVGHCEDDRAKSVRPLAKAGNDKGYLERARMRWDAGAAAQNPAALAALTGKPSCVNDVARDAPVSPWRTAALECGYASMLALPLLGASAPRGAPDLPATLNLCAAARGAFDAGAIEDYARLASHVADALTRLRSRLAAQAVQGKSARRSDEQRRRTEEALRASEARWRAMFEISSLGVCLLDENFRYLATNRAYQAMLGYSDEELRGMSPADLSLEEEGETNRALFTELTQGKRQYYDLVKRLKRKDGSLSWVHVYGFAVPGSDFTPPMYFGTLIDITEAKLARDALQAAERQQLLMHELSHRMKNMLTLVQAITTQTMRSAGSLEEARQALSARIGALGVAQDLLLQSANSADIADIVRGVSALHGGLLGRIRVTGPAVQLKPKAALAVTLTLHELATNAAKYGALSNDAGRVEIGWRILRGREGERFTLVWSEHDGPPVEPPARRGFGSRLIERGIAGELGGEVQVLHEPAGLVCTLSAPVDSVHQK
jgi:PAS domain S-box-containing protein